MILKTLPVTVHRLPINANGVAKPKKTAPITSKKSKKSKIDYSKHRDRWDAPLIY